MAAVTEVREKTRDLARTNDDILPPLYTAYTLVIFRRS